MSDLIPRITAAACLCAAACLGSVNMLKATEAPAPAPAPGSPAIYLSNRQLADVMRASIAKGSVPALSQISSTDQYFINEVHRTKVTGASAHPGWTEVHIVLAGSGTFVTGGEIKALGNTKIIEGGVSRKVGKGDVIIVPANTPHWYSKIDGSLDAIEVRFMRTDAGQTPQ